MTMKFNEITEPKTNATPVVVPKTNAAPVAVPKSDEKALQPDATFATRNQIKQLAANLAHDIPDVRFEVKTKSGLPYVRIFGSDKQTITNYLKQYGYDNLPL